MTPVVHRVLPMDLLCRERIHYEYTSFLQILVNKWLARTLWFSRDRHSLYCLTTAGELAAAPWRLLASNYQGKPQHTWTATTKSSRLSIHRSLRTLNNGSTTGRYFHISARYATPLYILLLYIDTCNVRHLRSDHLLSPSSVSVRKPQ